MADPTDPRPPQPPPFGVPVGEPYGTAPPELGGPRTARNPLPAPPGLAKDAAAGARPGPAAGLRPRHPRPAHHRPRAAGRRRGRGPGAAIGGQHPFELFLSWTPVLVIGFLLARNREGWPGIGLTRLRAGDVAMGLILWVASFILVLVLAQLFRFFGQREVDFLPEGLPLWFRAIQAVLIAVTAGVTEEIVVRGYAQTRLEQLRASTAVILLLPTALWGVLHVYQGLGAALTIFGLGLMYAWYFNRTRRLWPLILAHILFDLTQLIFILAGS